MVKPYTKSVQSGKPKILAVIGPTASGKSELAIRLALDFNGEIVNADSRQLYKGMDIGTAKPSEEDMRRAPHHLIDIAEPDEKINLYDFQRMAFSVIDEILQRGKLPILVGGTGLFVSAVIENFSLSSAGVDEDLRRELHNLSDDELIRRLLQFEPETTVDLKNRRRVIRQLEYFMLDPGYEPGKDEPRYEVMIIEPHFERAELYSRINKRVKEMFENGLPDEVQGLVDRYGWEAHAMDAIGYSEFRDSFDLPNLPKHKRDLIIHAIQQDTRRYAKRQVTWFKKYQSQAHIHKDYDETSDKVQKFIEN